MTWLDRSREWVINFYYKFLIAYGMGFFCLAATLYLDPVAPITPLGYYTIVWVLAFFFPGSAFLYAIFNLRVRFNEIQDVAQRNQFYFVYFPGLDEPSSQREFFRFLRVRFAEYYNVLELAAFSLVAGMLAFLGEFFLVVQFSIPPHPFGPAAIELPDVVPKWVLVTGASFAGAFAGAVVLVFKRYRTFDIYPSTYLQVSVGLIVGTLAGALLVALWPATYTAFLAFAAAFLTVTNINFLPRLLRQEFARLTGATLPPEIPTDLGRVLRNSEAIESLTSVSLFSVAEFAKTEPVRLYLTMAQPIGVINGWVDEALIHYYFETQVDALRKVHIHRFTQLVELLAAEFRKGGIDWRPAAPGAKRRITGDPAVDADIEATVKIVVTSRVHHRLLGLLSENYRRAHFLP